MDVIFMQHYLRKL